MIVDSFLDAIYRAPSSFQFKYIVRLFQSLLNVLLERLVALPVLADLTRGCPRCTGSSMDQPVPAQLGKEGFGPIGQRQ